MKLRIHADFRSTGLVWGLLYDLLPRSQRSSWRTISDHSLVRFSYASLLVRIRSGLLLHLHISNIDLDDRSRSLSSLSSPPSTSPAKNLFDQPQDDRYSDRGEEGCVNSEFMFVRL